VPEEPLFHLAIETDWTAAQATGAYTTSTVGRTLDEVGFIHLSRADQVDGVAASFYAGRTDVLLLTVDPELLEAPLREDVVGTTSFPHLYGPLPLAAVTAVARYRPA
jgi:glutathione S-transferase